jgi:hypothetical protein
MRTVKARITSRRTVCEGSRLEDEPLANPAMHRHVYGPTRYFLLKFTISFTKHAIARYLADVEYNPFASTDDNATTS